MMYIDALVDKETGTLVSPYGASYPVVGGTGWNSGKRKVDAIDLFADGAYELFGRQHNMMFGGSYSKQNNRYFSAWANVFPDDIGNFSAFNGNFPNPLGATKSGAGRYHAYEIAVCRYAHFAGRPAASDSWRSLYQLAC